ncbi:cytochrome-c oxidase, cbb3-type subunit III [Thiohalophilus sp.]|uniref:cytochrome-c oxidase, cbb3-type subunit III n=1 Tax=Thiohalophilus sp. TaxID=3028392 RepID=UPI0039758971
MSSFWSWFVAVISLGMIFACYWLIRWTTKRRSGEAAEGDVTGHTWDGNLEEYNNPLPSWWLWLFYITIIFALIYLLLYPGLGNFRGVLNWSSTDQYEQEMEAARQEYGPIFARYAETGIPALAQDDEAMASGRRLFLNYCATCHGSDAGGASGFPSLKDDAWLWGGEPEAIKTSILEGRTGVMPAHQHLEEEAIDNVTAYVQSLSGREVDQAKVSAGKQVFDQNCAVCHAQDGTGNTDMGAPDLTDNIWLYGGSPGVIRKTIRDGRQGEMPAHREFLGENKVHLLTAYVYSLSD